jgi:hypothetical protein
MIPSEASLKTLIVTSPSRPLIKKPITFVLVESFSHHGGRLLRICGSSIRRDPGTRGASPCREVAVFGRDPEGIIDSTSKQTKSR